MKVWSKSELRNSFQHVDNHNFDSYRLLVSDDGAQYSVHDTVIRSGETLNICYKHQEEFVYMVSGTGYVYDCFSGVRHELSPGVCYYLSIGDEHELHAITDLRGICVFTPPTRGDEVHDDTGGYPAINDLVE
ncbi:ectoine synthase [Halomonas binhaiensis]|uniref:L-ectoine synthase n=1 Tax=Halomonas binhaiensis TaxID=2562282 RepID=A0A5C1NEX4_9GAMM|nr:ectoine synthase [Halomonas binhaiensis]